MWDPFRKRSAPKRRRVSGWAFDFSEFDSDGDEGCDEHGTGDHAEGTGDGTDVHDADAMDDDDGGGDEASRVAVRDRKLRGSDAVLLSDLARFRVRVGVRVVRVGVGGRVRVRLGLRLRLRLRVRARVLRNSLP